MECKSSTIFGFDEDAADLLTMKVTDELHHMLLEKLVWNKDKKVDVMLLSNTHNRKGVRGCCSYCYIDCGTYATSDGESSVSPVKYVSP